MPRRVLHEPLPDGAHVGGEHRVVDEPHGLGDSPRLLLAELALLRARDEDDLGPSGDGVEIAGGRSEADDQCETRRGRRAHRARTSASSRDR